MTEQKLKDGKEKTLSDLEKEKRREAHTKIEQQRREKSAQYYASIFQLLPPNGEKRTKANILDHATRYIRETEAKKAQSPGYSDNPSMLSNQEFHQIFYEAYGGFIMVIDCSTGIILHVDPYCQEVLGFDKYEITNCPFSSLLINEKEIKKVTDYLLSQPSNNSHIDSKSGALLTGTHNTQPPRRAIICKMKCKRGECINVQITGYVKQVDPGQSHLICVIKPVQQTPNDINAKQTSPATYSTRHGQKGEILFVDQDFSQFMGYESNEFLRKKINFICENTVLWDNAFSRVCEEEKVENIELEFKKKDGTKLQFLTTLKYYSNPFNNNFQFIIGEHKLKDLNGNFTIIETFNDPSTDTDTNEFGSLFEKS